MKIRFRLYRRSKTFYCEDTQNGKQESLGTKDRTTALRLLHAKNEAHLQPAINLQMARAYLVASDPVIGKRTWQIPMDEIVKLKRGNTQQRWQTAIKDKAFDIIR
ncbi:MAG: hypothetical protein NTZ16_14430, partial [Verrucomicrobia bacterium]|nr:hypothetical protein [Verrucomicrobiota bacterium]